jgi:hypothetical protein
MTHLGLSSKREVTRTSIRVRTAMAVQVREQGRYLGGRPPYGYRLGDAGPHPNKAHAAWGRRARRLEPDPETAHIVRWIFARRLAGHSVVVCGADRAGAERGCCALPVSGGPGPEPALRGRGMDAGHDRDHLVQPAIHGPSGVEPAADRPRPGRPGRCEPGAQERAAVEPARRMGHLPQTRPPRFGQRGRLHRRPGRRGRARPAPAGSCRTCPPCTCSSLSPTWGSAGGAPAGASTSDAMPTPKMSADTGANDRSP